MARTTVLVVKKGFTAGGVDFDPGMEIDFNDPEMEKVMTRWPHDALTNRLNNGFLTYETQEIESTKASAEAFKAAADAKAAAADKAEADAKAAAADAKKTK